MILVKKIVLLKCTQFNNMVFSACTTDSWNELNIVHSTIPANLPVRYLTAVSVRCIEGYTTNSVLKCGANAQFTGENPTCYAGTLYNFLLQLNLRIPGCVGRHGDREFPVSRGSRYSEFRFTVFVLLFLVFGTEISMPVFGCSTVRIRCILYTLYSIHCILYSVHCAVNRVNLQINFQKFSEYDTVKIFEYYEVFFYHGNLLFPAKF